jgi:hypothetical protein
MKKILVLASILLLSIQSFAAWKSGMLRLRHEMGRSISVTIDGRNFNKIGKSITVGDLTPGNHRIKIYKYNTNGHGYFNGILIYQGSINVRPGRIYYGVVSNEGLNVEENCCLDDYGHWNNNDNWDLDENYVDENSHSQGDDNSWNHNQQSNHHNGDSWSHSQQSNHHDEDDTWNNNHQWNQNNNHDNYTDHSWDSYNGQMSESRFLLLIEQIRKASFESSKESVAKQGLKLNKITCAQLLRILNEFSFESTKLQFAKDAYKSVVDRNNYFMINDAFTFQSSKDEMKEFLDRIDR